MTERQPDRSARAVDDRETLMRYAPHRGTRLQAAVRSALSNDGMRGNRAGLVVASVASMTLALGVDTASAAGDGSAGFVLIGIDANDRSGSSVSGVGDVNGDGIDDVIVSAPDADPNGLRESGEAYVVFGRSTGFPAAIELKSLLANAGGDGSTGFVLKGVDAFDFSGRSAGGAGDVNGDGIDDIIIGASDADPGGLFGVGESYVVFGRTNGFPADFELRSLFPAAGGDGSEGFVLQGVDGFDQSGISVDTAGDVNGDGIDDLLIGAYTASPNGQLYAGETYLVFGRDTDFPATFQLRSLFPAAGGDGSSGVVLKGRDDLDLSGRSVSGAGDVNGDGIDDLIVGAYQAAFPGESNGGESYVVFGRDSGFPATFELQSLLPGAGGDGSEGFVLRGLDDYDASGYAVSGAGDIDNDGIDDLIIGALTAITNGRFAAGESYVVFGRDTGFPASLELRSLFPAAGGDGSSGFVLSGAQAVDLLGSSVSCAGDINGDGIDDLIVGARGAFTYEGYAGESYVLFGRTTGFPARIDIRSLFPAGGGDGSAGFVLSGVDNVDNNDPGESGASVGAAGDVNGDGIDDLIIGAPGRNPDDKLDAGESYVIFGRTQGFPANFPLSRLLP